MQAAITRSLRSMPGIFPAVRATRVLPAIALLLSFTLAACSTAPVAPKTPARLGLKLSPASLGQSLSLQQHLKVEREGRVDELDTALEIDADRLTLVGLAFGQRVMTIEYDGKELKTWRHFMLPAQVRGEDVLEDLQLTLWPADAIRAALPADWVLQDMATPPGTAGPGMRRTLSFQGQVIMTIDYPGQQRWGGNVVLDNVRYHYRLTIASANGA